MKRLHLSHSDSRIAGVCGGIGETYDIDPTLVRLIFVALLIFSAVIPMVIVYLIAYIIMPRESEL